MIDGLALVRSAGAEAVPVALGGCSGGGSSAKSGGQLFGAIVGSEAEGFPVALGGCGGGGPCAEVGGALVGRSRGSETEGLGVACRFGRV
jgi:hypothetical protein